jgi:hypothetical protein
MNMVAKRKLMLTQHKMPPDIEQLGPMHIIEIWNLLDDGMNHVILNNLIVYNY